MYFRLHQVQVYRTYIIIVHCRISLVWTKFWKLCNWIWSLRFGKARNEFSWGSVENQERRIYMNAKTDSWYLLIFSFVIKYKHISILTWQYSNLSEFIADQIKTNKEKQSWWISDVCGILPDSTQNDTHEYESHEIVLLTQRHFTHSNNFC